MERKFLSGRSANGEDVAVLRRTLFDYRDQLHFPPDPGAEDNRELENADIGQIPVRAQSAPVRFALKAPQKITHWSKLKDCAGTLEYFCKVVTGLGERLGPVLFQLPPTFKKDADVLSSFLREFPSMRAAFEFRHDSWFDDEIFDLLKSRNISLCIADTDDLATPKKITADYGYLRLRRADYQKSDVENWAKFVREQKSNWKDAFVYFKHEESGMGPKLAKQMLELLAA